MSGRHSRRRGDRITILAFWRAASESENCAKILFKWPDETFNQCTAKNEYAPRGMVTADVLGLQKCNVTVSAPLA